MKLPENLKWMSVYLSPFRFFLPRFYIGKVAVGVPYFYPRRWVKATRERAHKAVLEYIKREEDYNEMNPNHARKIRPYKEVFEEKMRCLYAVQKHIGFDIVGLGWKTKWSDTDYRHEWNPVWSFVFFGLQVALIFRPPEDSHYWECYLAYTRNTDKKLPVKERIKQARKLFPCIWTGKDGSTDYWELILKKKWL